MTIGRSTVWLMTRARARDGRRREDDGGRLLVALAGIAGRGEGGRARRASLAGRPPAGAGDLAAAAAARRRGRARGGQGRRHRGRGRLFVGVGSALKKVRMFFVFVRADERGCRDASQNV